MIDAPSDLKLRPLWRGLATAIALLIGVFEFVGYRIARSINLNYFNDPHTSTSALQIAGLVIALYLFVVALTGYVRPHWKGS